MKLHIRAGLLASALMLSTAPLVASAAFSPATAAQVDISFRYFHSRLTHSGDWVYSDRWGEVWLPAYVDADWRPYSRGYWVDTDEYGWLWVSTDDEFGDITSHYGRWVNDPYDGWMWVPGYVWSPAWVVWRRSGDYTGWMPMPPDQRFLAGEEFGNVSFGMSVGGVSIGFNNWGNTDGYYGYARWYGRGYSRDRFNALWTFVPVRHFADRDYRRYQAPRRALPNFLRASTNITNYIVVNNYIVNRSVSEKSFKDVDFKAFHRVRAADVVRQPALIAPVDRGRELQLRMQREMPRGTGLNNSAPKPTQAQVQTLSVPTDPQAEQRAKKRAARLMTHDAAVAVARPNGSEPAPLTPADSIKAKDATGDKKSNAGNITPSPVVQTPAPVAAPANDVGDKTHDKLKKAEPTAVPSSPDTAPADTVHNKGKHTKDNTMAAPAGAPPQTPAEPRTEHVKAPDVAPAAVTNTPSPAAAGTEHKKNHDKASENGPGAATTDAAGTSGGQTTQPGSTEVNQNGEKKKKKHPTSETTAPEDAPH